MASSPNESQAPALERPAEAGRIVAPFGVFGIHVPGTRVWDIRAPCPSVCARTWSGAGGYSTRTRRVGIWIEGFVKRMQGSYLRGGERTGSDESERGRRKNIVHFCGIVRGGRRDERAICRQACRRVKSLAEGDCKNGEKDVVFPTDRRGPFHINGFEEGVQRYAPAPEDEKLVHISICQALLSVCRPPVWLGKITTVFHPSYGYVCEGIAKLGLPCVALRGRLPLRSISGRSECNGIRLRGDYCSNRFTHQAARAAKARRESTLEGHDSAGTSWRNHRQRDDAVCSDESAGKPCQRYGKGVYENHEDGPTPCNWKLRSFYGMCVALSLTIPWARFYTHWFYWDLSGPGEEDHRGRVRLSHQSMRDLRFWETLKTGEETERVIQPSTPQASFHTDAADLGYVGSLHTDDMAAGVAGMWVDKGVLKWQERVNHITLRELKTIRKILMGALGEEIKSFKRRDLLIHVDNSAVVHITNSFLSASRQMMQELRKLKVVLDLLGLRIRSEWLPLALNRYADALSRRVPVGDLQVRRTVRRSILDGMQQGRDVFPYRLLGEPPIASRNQSLKELEGPWDPNETRLLCSPLVIALPTVRKLVETKAPAVLLLSHWPRQPWYQMVVRIAGKVEILPMYAEEMWTGKRNVNPKWKLAYMEVNLPPTNEPVIRSDG